MKEIARLAGTSLSTVSRALNDNPAISESVRGRIQQLARELGFEVNARGRSLATSRNGTIGIIFPDSLDDPDNASFAGMLLRSVRAILEANALDPLVSFVRTAQSRESNIRRLIRQGKVDGLLLIVPALTGEEYETLLETSVPFVFLHFLPEDAEREGMEHVYVDHIEGGRLATSYLLRQGARRILTITERERQFLERTAGYRRAHLEEGVPVQEELILSVDATYEAARSAIIDNSRSIAGIDAIFAQADVCALGAISALRELGVEVPGTLPVVGYDDIRMAAIATPSLTTVHQPQEELARLACNRLVELLAHRGGEDSFSRILQPRLVVRESAPERTNQ